MALYKLYMILEIPIMTIHNRTNNLFRLEFRESGVSSYSGGLNDGDAEDWIVVNIPAPRHDVTHGATATTTLPMHHDGDEDEVNIF